MRERARRGCRAWRLAAILLVTPLASCLDVGLLADTTFPPEVPGLPAGQPWVSLPVRSWVVEGDVKVRAVSACFEATCRPQAAVVVFDVAGPDATRLRAALRDPASLERELVARALLRPPVRSGRRRGAPAPGDSLPATRIEVVAASGTSGAGLTVRLARPDGSRSTFGVISAVPRPGGMTVVIVIAPSQQAASSLAQDVAHAI